MDELGIVQNLDGSEFIPTFENVAQWDARWVPLDTTDQFATICSIPGVGNTLTLAFLISIGTFARKRPDALILHPPK